MPEDLLADSVSVTTKTSGWKFKHKDNADSNDGIRLVLAKLIVIGLFLILLASLIKLQVFAGNYYRDLAQNNRIREVPIHAPRGIIFDRNGQPLTANLPAFRVGKQTISKDQAIALEVAGSNPEIDSVRSYLYGPAFAHLLGYVSEIAEDELARNRLYVLGDRLGRGGVEEAYEEKLRGVAGRELIEVDAVGAKLRTISQVSPIHGQNLTLSIDAKLQRAGYELLKDKKGAMIATNPQTGEILALVSTPSFDPEEIKVALEDSRQPLFDRVISGTYPPGSTFKIITATAGLETGAISSATRIEDTGILEVGPYKFPNWKWLRGGGVEGILDVVGAIARSNDIFFYRVGEWVGVDHLMGWAKKFGLGSKLGVDLPGEAAGLVPDENWRKENTRSWYLGDTYHVAIGQGDVLVTPLQMNAWTNVIANGGKLCTPRVIDKISCKDLGIKNENVELIKKGMMAACSAGGTGWPFFDFKVKTACKTGTAEFGDPAKGQTHAWFTIFAPVVKPEISLTVLVEGGGEGSDVAAPIARKILDEYFKN